MKVSLQDISIRTDIRAGDIGRVVSLHGLLYKQEYNYGIEFESYVAGGLCEFYQSYNEKADRAWVCEYNNDLAGFLLLMHRENNSAQLRFFVIGPDFRGIGLGRKLMDLYFDFLHSCNYQSSFLWTASELHTAATLYTRYGFQLTEEKSSNIFGKPVTEQRYEWLANR